MKKALVVLCLWTAASIVMLFSLSGQKNVLRDDWQSAVRKNDVLQALHDEAKKEWEDEKSALTLENEKLADTAASLTAENEALKRETETLAEQLKTAQQETQEALAEAEKQAAEALEQARQEWEDQRIALTAEKDAASGRLSEVLAFLLTPSPEMEASPAPETMEEGLFTAEETLPIATPTPKPSSILDMFLAK